MDNIGNSSSNTAKVKTSAKISNRDLKTTEKKKGSLAGRAVKAIKSFSNKLNIGKRVYNKIMLDLHKYNVQGAELNKVYTAQGATANKLKFEQEHENKKPEEPKEIQSDYASLDDLKLEQDHENKKPEEPEVIESDYASLEDLEQKPKTAMKSEDEIAAEPIYAEVSKTGKKDERDSVSDVYSQVHKNEKRTIRNRDNQLDDDFTEEPQEPPEVPERKYADEEVSDLRAANAEKDLKKDNGLPDSNLKTRDSIRPTEKPAVDNKQQPKNEETLINKLNIKL